MMGLSLIYRSCLQCNSTLARTLSTNSNARIPAKESLSNTRIPSREPEPEVALKQLRKVIQRSGTLVVLKRSADSMYKLRIFQKFWMSALTATTVTNMGFLSYWWIYEPLQMAWSFDQSIALTLATPMAILIPSLVTCVVGRIELTPLDNTIKVSNIDYFGNRRDKVWGLDGCFFTRDRDTCLLPDMGVSNIIFRYVISWKDTLENEKAARYICLYTKVNFDGKDIKGYLERPRSISNRERAFLAVVLATFLTAVYTIGRVSNEQYDLYEQVKGLFQ